MSTDRQLVSVKNLFALAREDFKLLQRSIRDIGAHRAYIYSSAVRGDTGELLRRSVWDAKNGDLPDQLKALMLALGNDGYIDEAREMAHRGMNLYPGVSDFFLFAGLLACEREDFNSALLYGRRAFAMEPQSDYYRLQFLFILRRVGKFAEAYSVLSEHLTVVPDNRGSLDQLATLSKDARFFHESCIINIFAAVQVKDFSRAQKFIQLRRAAEFVGDERDIYQSEDEMYYQYLIFLLLRMGTCDHIFDPQIHDDTNAFLSNHEKLIHKLGMWKEHSALAVLFYFLLGKMEFSQGRPAIEHFRRALKYDSVFKPAQIWVNALAQDLSPQSIFASLGVPLIHDKWKYRLGAAMLALETSSKEVRPQSVKTIICLRGICDSKTVLVAKFYKYYYPECILIVSTWDGTAYEVADDLKQICDMVILNSDPKFTGPSNINRQLCCGYAAVEAAISMGAEYIFLSRTDFIFFKYDLINKMHEICRRHVAADAINKLLVSDLYSRKWIDRHMSDIFVFGRAAEVFDFFSAPWYITTHQMPGIPEIYLTNCYLERRHMSSAFESRANWLSVMVDLFIIEDMDWFEACWLKRPKLRNSEGELSRNECFRAVDYNEILLSSDRMNVTDYSQIAHYTLEWLLDI